MKCLWHIPLQVKRSQVKQSHRGYSKFCRVRSIFQVKRSGSHRSFEVFIVSAPWLLPFLTESLHMWHTYNTWRVNVPCPIFRTKGLRLRSHVSFQFLALSALWLRPYLTAPFHMWHTYNTWGDDTFPGRKVKGQGHTGRFMFWPSPLLHFVCGIHTTHEGRMCHASFSGSKVKGQGYTGRSKFLSCPPCGFLLIWPNHFIWGIHTT